MRVLVRKLPDSNRQIVLFARAHDKARLRKYLIARKNDAFLKRYIIFYGVV